MTVPGPSPSASTPAARWRVPALVAACCVLSWIAKTVAIAARTGVDHGDVSFYFNVACSLAEGRGFVIDYIWSFWGDPQGIPTPSNLWWMPLASILAAIGMRLGDGDYASAQAATTLVSSLTPLVTYLLGRDLFRSRGVGLAGAALAATFHVFLNRPSAPLSHSPYVVLAPLSLWLILRSLERPRLLWFVGASIALTHLSRSDGVLLLGTAVAAHLIAARRLRLVDVAALVVGYALVMSPWWARNLATFGALQPGSSMRGLFLREYEAWYAMPESVTAASWLADGWGPVLAHKAQVAGINLRSFALDVVEQALGPRAAAWRDPAVVGLAVLVWTGLLTTLRRRFAFVWFHAAAEWTFYSLLFTAVGPESFRSGLFSVLPFMLLCAAEAARRLAGWLARPFGSARERAAAVLWTLIVLALVAGQFQFGRRALADKGFFVQKLARFYDTLGVVLDSYGLREATFMARNVHELHALLDVRCVQIPYDDEDAIRAAARRFGVTHLLMIGEGAFDARPALRGIDDREGYERVVGPTLVQGTVVRVYAFTGL